MRTGIYAGAFDPVTNGHLDIAERASQIFDEVVVAIARDSYKQTLFTIEERMELISHAIGHLSNVRVEFFSGLLVDFCKTKQSPSIIRGLRAVSDFDMELQMALMNRQLDNSLDTVFLMASAQYLFISSNLIKNAASLGGDVSALVPSEVQAALYEKYHQG